MHKSVEKLSASENVGDNVELRKHFLSFFPEGCVLTDMEAFPLRLWPGGPKWNGSCDMIHKITGGS